MQLKPLGNQRRLRSSVRAVPKPLGDGSSIPPPPPTVAPPEAPDRKPKERSAYRQRKKTAEEREQEKAQQQVSSPGRTHYLDSAALQQRHAAVTSQQRRGRPRSPSHAASAAAVGAAARQPLVIIDGYNMLHFHPSTKLLMDSDQIDQARALLHQLLSIHAKSSAAEVLVVYDATSVSSTRQDSTSVISAHVRAVFKAGYDADSIIIDSIKALHQQAQQAEAAGAGVGSQQRQVNVYTNDRRIADSCNEPVLAHGYGARVSCHPNRELSDALQLIENKLNLSAHRGSSAAAAAAAAAVAAGSMRGVRALPDMNHNTLEWAKRVTRPAGTAAADLGSRLQPRHQHKQRRQKQQEGMDSRELEPLRHLSDEQLLLQAQWSAAAIPAASVTGAEAGDAAAATADSDGNLAAVSASAAAGQRPLLASTTQHLDDLLSTDLDLLGDVD